jgi:hypothetical protein
MNLACNISDFEIEKTVFLDIKKNIIIDGTFTKLIYSTSNVIFNGIYLIFPIIITDEESNKKTPPFYKKNTYEEGSIRESITSDGRSKTAHRINEDGFLTHPHLEHWQRGDSLMKIGGKYHISSFSILNQHNINIIKELNRIEHSIIEYAKDYYNINKTNIYSLRNQLKHGSIKIYNSLQTRECDNTNTIIKISGIWENDQNIGITYKFLNN